LINQLRQHGRGVEFEVAWVGEGWRLLVEECHRQLVAVFPAYELVNIKQKYGALAYQAFACRWVAGESRWSDVQKRELERITDEFRRRSEAVCKWCGGNARLRAWRTVELTLCDDCDRRFPDPAVSISSSRAG
jgi:hypothetical protein